MSIRAARQASRRYSVSGRVHASISFNRHNSRVLGSEIPHDVTEHERGSPKVNMWCTLMKNKVNRSFFFEETTVTSDTFLAMMGDTPLLTVPVGTVFKLDGTLLHFSNHIRAFFLTGTHTEIVNHTNPAQLCLNFIGRF
jgi:CRISPR/Cas system-associated exonuclease Cas4 (RecB family)